MIPRMCQPSSSISVTWSTTSAKRSITTISSTHPYRDYPAPIIAIPGNHDGEIYAGDPRPTLDAFLRNFCSASPEHTPEATGLVRTSMIAPGVFFTLEAPFVRILGLYSNVLEDPGVISSEGVKSSPVTDQQLNFLTAALTRAKSFLRGCDCCRTSSRRLRTARSLRQSEDASGLG